MNAPRLAAALAFLRRVVAEGRRDEVLLRASALAFSTLTSLVPLLAVVTIFVARALLEDDGRMVKLLTGLLPYREESVIAALESFLAQVSSISGVAVLGFVVIALLTFFGVQDSLFQIFGVERPPSWPRRVATFSLLFFWGPLLVGSAHAGLLLLEQSSSAAAKLLSQSTLVRTVPPLITFVGLSMLYWRAAFGRVRLRHAAAAGLLATVALVLLKFVFTFYVREFTAVQLAVYGTFAIAFFFVLSIELAWTILLYGAEIASCLATAGDAAAESRSQMPDPWLGMAALELLGAEGRPPLDRSAMARRLGVPVDELERSLAPLVAAGLLARDATAGHGLRLALPARQTRLAAVLAAYRRGRESSGAPGLPRRALELRSRLGRATEYELGEQTLADLLAGADAGPPASRAERAARDLAGSGGGG